MKILISHVYSSNNGGDAAILAAQISALKRSFKKPQINVLSVEKIRPGYQFEGVPVTNSLMYWAIAGKSSQLIKLAKALVMMTWTLLGALTWRLTKLKLPLIRAWRRPMELLYETDMQVGVGGGYLRAKADHASTISLVLLCHQIWLAKLLNKPVYLYAQSFGPYPNHVQRLIAGTTLKLVDLILVRESISRELLVSLGISQNRLVQVPDSAFAFKPKVKVKALKVLGSNKASDKLVGVTVRAWLSGSKQAHYERAMANLIDYIAHKPGYKVVVIPQVTATDQNDDDRLVGTRIKQLLTVSNDVVVHNNRLTHDEIKSLMAGLNYLVGTRFHSVIFALSSGVPAIAIEYEHKTSGIMKDLGLYKWVINIEEVGAKRLITRFDRLVKEHDAYQQQLRRVVPDYINKADQAAQLIKQAYERSLDDDNVPSQ